MQEEVNRVAAAQCRR